MEYAYTQHRGNVARIQQDALLAGHVLMQQADSPVVSETADAERFLVAVADGVGSSPYPQLVSRYVLDLLAQELAVDGAMLDTRLIRRIHGRLCERYAKGRTYGSATTLAAVLFKGENCVVLNVGDSRIYRIDSSGRWCRLSRDHTVLADLIEKGIADPLQQYGQIYNALEHCLIADDEEDDFAVHCVNLVVHPGDTLLLCTDGVYESLGEEEMRFLFDGNVPLEMNVAHYREAVLAAGAMDNFSLIMVRAC